MSDMSERERLILCRKIAHARGREIARLNGIIEAQREQLGRQSEALIEIVAGLTGEHAQRAIVSIVSRNPTIRRRA